MNLTIFLIIAISATGINAFTCPDTELHPAERDINYCYQCLASGLVGIPTYCVDGTGFLKNKKHIGCIPFESWECTDKKGAKPPLCTSEDRKYLSAHVDPNYYWICVKPNTPAIKMRCPTYKFFVDTEEYIGCTELHKWSCSDIVRS